MAPGLDVFVSECRSDGPPAAGACPEAAAEAAEEPEEVEEPAVEGEDRTFGGGLGEGAGWMPALLGLLWGAPPAPLGPDDPPCRATERPDGEGWDMTPRGRN